MRKKYKVKLTHHQREQLLEIVHNGKQQAKTITHARIILGIGNSMALFNKSFES